MKTYSIKFGFSVGMSALLLSACSSHMLLPKVSQQEIDQYYNQFLTDGGDTSHDSEMAIKWIQASNKKEPCKMFVGVLGNDDRTEKPDYKIFWDGECKSGYAYGLGREFERGVLVDTEAIAIYSGKVVMPNGGLVKFSLNKCSDNFVMHFGTF